MLAKLLPRSHKAQSSERMKELQHTKIDADGTVINLVSHVEGFGGCRGMDGRWR